MPRPVFIYDSRERLRVRLPQQNREFLIDERVQDMSAEVVIMLLWALQELSSSSNLQDMRQRLQTILSDFLTEVAPE